MIRAAIFDLDGVLLDSMGIWKDLGSRYLKSKGIRPEPELSRILFSMSMEQGAAYLKTHYPLSERKADIVNDIAALLEHFYFYEVPAKPGAEALLRFLCEQGIPLAAATSSPRAHVIRALARLGLLSRFTAVLTTGEVGESKHSPAIYHAAAAALSAKPEETLVFEDSLYALQTAAAAGYRTVGVFDAEGESDQDGLRTAAEVYLTSLSAFPSHWKQFNP